MSDACHERDIFSRSHSARETHLDRGSVLPGHRKLSRAAHLARESVRKGERVKEWKRRAGEEAGGRREDAGLGEDEKGSSSSGCSRALLNIVAHTELPDRREHTRPFTRSLAHSLARTCVSVRARARAHANSVLSKDWKPGEAPLHEILRAL